MAKAVVLDVAVVGAGIAGLSAAVAIARSGHNVEIYERSQFSNEVGAAINCCPNATRVLEEWGFDFEAAQAVRVKKGMVINAKTMEINIDGRYNMKEIYGADWYLLHRVDLHSGIRKLAVEKHKIPLHLSSEVDSADCETGIITFADGRTLQKDLIVAADGIHSRFVREVTGSDTEAVETGHSAFRFLIPTDKVAQLNIPIWLYEADPAGLVIATDGIRRLVCYPCRGGELMNLVAIHPDRHRKGEREAWNVQADLQDLLDEYKDFHPDLVKLCSAAEDLKLWRLLYRSPNPAWFRGKLVLVGDSIHPMLPHQGQGGAQAIESGAAIGALLEDLPSKDALQERLRMYQEVRFKRAAAIQIFSNAGQEEGYKIEEEARKYVQGPIPKNPAEFQKFNFSHSVNSACKAALTSAA